MNALQVDRLTRVYRSAEKEEGLKGTFKALFHKKVIEKTAVSDFSFEAGEGEMIGLIGPNGAGKTTLIKMLSGIIHPTSGSALVYGFDPSRPSDSFKKKISVVMGQKSQLWWDLPAIDSFLLDREIYELPEDRFRKNVALYSEMFGVEDLLKTQVRQLSLGERMKMELILSLLHDPAVLFLDEPTIGLDAIAQKQIRQLLSRINVEKKVTVLLTSHYMEDIRHVCSRVMVVNHGLKIFDGAFDALLDRFNEYKTISVTFENEAGLEPDFEAGWIQRDPYKWHFKVRREQVRPVLQTILNNCDVDDLKLEDEDIGDVIEKIYGVGAVS
ncbi:MAG TPA: ATP-binding cassette domain-containing protein [Clostridia bacterium]|nr:ATP-binding cassette domain-containing protein [Clostridia bacterium]